ncbi:MAG: hypothetical protein R3E66_08780 [bacterium]
MRAQKLAAFAVVTLVSSLCAASPTESNWVVKPRLSTLFFVPGVSFAVDWRDMLTVEAGGHTLYAGDGGVWHAYTRVGLPLLRLGARANTPGGWGFTGSASLGYSYLHQSQQPDGYDTYQNRRQVFVGVDLDGTRFVGTNGFSTSLGVGAAYALERTESEAPAYGVTYPDGRLQPYVTVQFGWAFW